MATRNQGGRSGAPHSGSPGDISYAGGKMNPTVAGMKEVAYLEGYDCVVPGMDMTPGAPLMAPDAKMEKQAPPEGGATWLGKGSSKTPFPL